jgi:hypothetical protein
MSPQGPEDNLLCGYDLHRVPEPNTRALGPGPHPPQEDTGEENTNAPPATHPEAEPEEEGPREEEEEVGGAEGGRTKCAKRGEPKPKKEGPDDHAPPPGQIAPPESPERRVEA